MCVCNRGEVLLKDGSLQSVALKTLRFEEEDERNAALNEVAALEEVRGRPHTVQLLAAFEAEEAWGNALCLALR